MDRLHLRAKTQSGLSLIATILALLMFSLFIAVAVSLVTTGAHIGVQETQGQQAFYIAEGGLHYTLALNKNNIPNYSTHEGWIPLGAGQFKVDTAYLTNNIAAGAATIPVESTANFPSAGRITIGTDFGITYLNKDGTNFLNASGGQTHNQYDSVYPASRVNTTISNDPTCSSVTINVDENLGAKPPNETGFKIPGMIFIDTEYFYCQDKTTIAPFQFLSCQRCYLGSAHAAHPAGRYASQYILTSTGRITNFLSNTVQRVVQITAGPREE